MTLDGRTIKFTICAAAHIIAFAKAADFGLAGSAILLGKHQDLLVVECQLPPCAGVRFLMPDVASLVIHHARTHRIPTTP